MLFPCQGKCHEVTKGCGQRRTRPYVAQSANHGEAVYIIAKGVYHQCKALYIITQSVDIFRPYNVAVYLYGFGIREPSPFGEGGGEADG